MRTNPTYQEMTPEERAKWRQAIDDKIREVNDWAMRAGQVRAQHRVQQEIAETITQPTEVLRRHLITSDYRGRAVKEAVLNELLARAAKGAL